MKVTEEVERTKDSYSAREVAASIYQRWHTFSGEARQVLPSEVGRRKLFLETLKNDGESRTE